MYYTLKALRLEKKITAEEMAIVLGLETKSAYHKKESGKVKFSLNEAKKISDYFNKPVEEIFFTTIVS